MWLGRKAAIGSWRHSCSQGTDSRHLPTLPQRLSAQPNPYSMKRSLVLLTSVLLGGTSSLQATGFDWPQWQGPNRNAISKEPGLMKEWPKAGPALAWKVTGVGGGDAAPAIAAGRIFVMGTKGEEEAIWALSEKDGKPLWSVQLGARPTQSMPQSQHGPGCTPTVD